MGSTDVTVVIPCYNTEKFLDQALKSAEANDRCSLEIIVVNDGSTDGSLAIMRAHEAADPRVRVIDKPNQGYGASVNRGFSEARGEYLAILEPDDYIEPHMYDDLVDFAHTFERAPDIVKSPYWRIWMPTTPKERRYQCSYYRRPMPDHQPFSLADAPGLIQHHPSIWSALYRRAFLEEKGVRFREVPGAGWVDNPFLIETMCQADRIVYLDTPYYCYREDLPGSSSSTRNLALSFERWNDMADIVDKLGVNDLGILKSFYVIGFRYIGGALGNGATKDPEIMEMIAGVFKRMDPSVVVACENVSPQMRRMAFEMAGRPVPKLSHWPYFCSLVSEFFYTWRTNGFLFAMKRVGIFFVRRGIENDADPSKTQSASI